MKRKILMAAAILGTIALMNACKQKTQRADDNSLKVETKQDMRDNRRTEKVITDNLSFCESIYPTNNKLLISNYGGSKMDPLNTNGQGYIVAYQNDSIAMIIPADGTLSAPKGMYSNDDYLFVSDVNKILVYDMDKPQAKPQVIRFPKADMNITNLVADGNTLYATVASTGNIYAIDIANMDKLNTVQPKLFAQVPGANDAIIEEGVMYITSAPSQGDATSENVIYYISDFDQPVAQKFINEAGQYYSITMSPDNQTMYVTNWSPSGIAKINMDTKAIDYMVLDTPVKNASDIAFMDDILYVADPENNQIIAITNP
ncbi:SMP-30/gluconolactonase/LRE family protein [Parabacteroides pacaensis]|uniref:SMP-30/gluconolactonase/LRE family protein n=1 Tax=Parabacteroides pacaensis TaxID=2086575 RepID=UPI00131CD7E9|nr:SMP-30/gluconolactonase/LRE family protein [Parabacteroides pacaensis]